MVCNSVQKTVLPLALRVVNVASTNVAGEQQHLCEAAVGYALPTPRDSDAPDEVFDHIGGPRAKTGSRLSGTNW
jgi:hypothetical protein